MTLTDEFKEYLSNLVDELRKSGKATYPNYVEELNKLYDVNQKLVASLWNWELGSMLHFYLRLKA